MKDFLKNMLTEFFWEINKEKWPGKERELVSRFAFSKLVKNISTCSEFYDSAQIGLEELTERNSFVKILLYGKNQIQTHGRTKIFQL